jgi:hypothetical protein
MSDRTEGLASALAAGLVLFTAMLDPWVSIGIAVVALAGLSVYTLRRPQRR